MKGIPTTLIISHDITIYILEPQAMFVIDRVPSIEGFHCSNFYIPSSAILWTCFSAFC